MSPLCLEQLAMDLWLLRNTLWRYEKAGQPTTNWPSFTEDRGAVTRGCSRREDFQKQRNPALQWRGQHKGQRAETLPQQELAGCPRGRRQCTVRPLHVAWLSLCWPVRQKGIQPCRSQALFFPLRASWDIPLEDAVTSAVCSFILDLLASLR